MPRPLMGFTASDRRRRLTVDLVRDGQDPGTAFGYDYRMTCEACGDTTVLTAQTYHERQSLDARIPCSHCPASIHFGPAVAALRDPNDPTLNDQSAADTAWFHTSTAHDWPSDTHTGPSGSACTTPVWRRSA